jgi:hypothetical protein
MIGIDAVVRQAHHERQNEIIIAVREFATGSG